MPVDGFVVSIVVFALAAQAWMASYQRTGVLLYGESLRSTPIRIDLPRALRGADIQAVHGLVSQASSALSLPAGERRPTVAALRVAVLRRVWFGYHDRYVRQLLKELADWLDERDQPDRET